MRCLSLIHIFDLLNGSKERITEREYWAAKKGQLALDKELSLIHIFYCRISLEDGGDNESMSISNQKLMLKDYAEKIGLFQHEYYVDDGYTGCLLYTSRCV